MGRHTAHQRYPSEVVIRYTFHPLCGVCCPVIRLHFVHEEACYVVRRANGMPLSVPVWMTQPEAAQIKIVCEPRLPVSALLDLRRLTTTCLSSFASSESKGGHDEAASDTATATVRRQQTISSTATTAGSAAASWPTSDAVDGSSSSVDQRGGGK